MADRGTGTRHLKLRRWHALAALAVVAIVAVPAGDALAAGRGRPSAPKAPRKSAVHKKPVRTSASPVLDLEKESVRRGWAWGQTVRGQVVMPDKNGNLTTVSLQRGVVTTVGPTSLVVTSADGVAITWTISKTTAIVAPKTRSITAGTTVRVWGIGTGTPSARLVIADPKAPRPSRTSPTAIPTSTTTTASTTTASTTTSTTTASTTTSTTSDPTDPDEPVDEENGPVDGENEPVDDES